MNLELLYGMVLSTCRDALCLSSVVELSETGDCAVYPLREESDSSSTDSDTDS